MGWIRNRIRPDQEFEKFEARSGPGIDHFGSTTLEKSHRYPIEEKRGPKRQNKQDGSCIIFFS